MDETVKLFANLVLALLGFVAPIMGLFLSLYREGILKLTEQAESEKSKAKDNIKEQMKKLESFEREGRDEIRKNLEELEDIEKITREKILHLNPKWQIFNMFIPLTISFVMVSFSFYNPIKEINLFYWVILLISFISLCYFVWVITILFSLVIEVKKIVDDEKKSRELKVIELLSGLSEKMKIGENLLEKVYIQIDDVVIKGPVTKLELDAEKKREFQITLNNDESRMAKNVEIGLHFNSPDFIIEKNDSFSLYIGKDGVQIVRFTTDFVQGRTDIEAREPLVITPLKKGDYDVITFVKGENIKTTFRKLKLLVK